MSKRKKGTGRRSTKANPTKFREPIENDDWKPWDLWERGVSYSFVDKWLQCRYQCYLRYVEGWKPKQYSAAIHFGWAFHEIMEFAYKRLKPPTRPAIKKLLNEYRTKVFKEHKLKGSARADVEEMIGLASVVAPHYFDNWPKDFDRKWLLLEKHFELPYVYEDGRETKLTGIIDAVYEDRGEPWVFDTKTSSRPDVDDRMKAILIDFQFMLYSHVLAESDLLDGSPVGVVVNVVRRPGVYRRKDEPLKDYLSRVDEDITSRPDYYFDRPSDEILPSDIERWRENQLRPIMDDIRRWYEAGCQPRYANPKALKVGYRKSDYFDAVTRGDFSTLEKRGTKAPPRKLKGLKRAGAKSKGTRKTRDNATGRKRKVRNRK